MNVTSTQEFRLLKICLAITGSAALLFMPFTWIYLKPGYFGWMYLTLSFNALLFAWMYWKLSAANYRFMVGLFILNEVAVSFLSLEFHLVQYMLVIFLLVFTFIMVFSVILMRWPEVIVFNALILGTSTVFMLWPATGFKESVRLLNLHPDIVIISIFIYQTLILVLGTGMVEIKRRTEQQLRFINENLNKLVEQKVAEIRRADREARRAEEQLDKILRYTPVGVVIFSEDLTCLYSNGVHFKFENADGVCRCRELPGNMVSLEMLCKILDNARKLAGEDAGAHLVGQRLDFVDADQCERMLRYSFIPVTLLETDDTPPFKRLILITEDITNEEMLRYKLIQSDHLASMGKMAAGLAHEINNPLSVIRIYVEALDQGLADTARREKIYLVLKENIHRIDRIIKSFLTFGRQEKPARELIDVLTVLKNTLELATNLQQFDEIKICTEYAEAVPPIFGDQHRLSQVFINLLNNARDAMQKRGGTLTINYFCEGRNVVVRFKDTGHGIKPEDLKHIFTPFFTTKEPGQGTGLGLSISYGIVQEHGGSLEAESHEGIGTTFTVRLPIPEPGMVPSPEIKD